MLNLNLIKKILDDIALAMACLENLKGKSQLYDLDGDTFL